MDEKFKRQMEENGADVDTVINRFMGKEDLYMKFIVKFLKDENYAGTVKSIEEGNYEAVFNYAHSLKGVTANLGLEPVRAVAADIADLLRGKQPQEVDKEQLSEYKKELEKSYESFKRIIEENIKQDNIS